MVLLRIRVTCIFQLNDFFALLFEKMHLLIYTLKENTLHTPSTKIPYIHPQSKYPTYTLKVNTYIHPQSTYIHPQSKYPIYTLKSKYPTYTLKSKYPTYTIRTLINLINLKNKTF